MSDFNIIKDVQVNKTFRVASVMGRFDLQSEHISEKFVGSIDLSREWQIGVIFGHSGTGKTVIARELFKDKVINGFQYCKSSVLDDMPENKTVDEIVQSFNSVGFSSPPSWLKPYNVLSNGEKMRVDLARAILSDFELFVFDEFTSVVDRDVAKISSAAISKAIKRTNKKFIAISCHDDILDWIEPDWIFNTNDMSFKYTRGLLQRPQIKIDVLEQKQMWKFFRKYHYLSGDINNSSRQFVGYYNDRPIVFCAVLHFPHAQIKNMKRVSRLVVLPDYQGVGIGFKMLNFIADVFKDYRFLITTTTPALINSFLKSKKWRVRRVGRVGRVGRSSSINTMQRTVSVNRYTTSWEYVRQ